MTPANGDDPFRTTAAPPNPSPDSDAADATVTNSPGGAAATHSSGLPTVPGYRLEAVIGRGGMGVVYKAHHLALKRTVALKMVLAGGHAGPGDLARFRTEAEAVARLQHPNIVQIHEVGEAGGHPYCALEFVEGGNLAGRLDGRPLSSRDAAVLVEALAQAMHLAHGRNVVHRDLKPANILLAADGTPKITDFGLARQLDVDGGDTQAGAVMGTPSYMAPEQASGHAHEAGPATDVYALGAILYECLAGRPPFKGATVVETLDLVRTREPIPPSRIQPKVPFDLETICLKAMAKEPDRRYATAAELAEDLRRFLHDEPIHARRVGLTEKLWRRARKNPALVGLAATVLLLGVVVGWVATRPRPEPPAPVVTSTPPEVDTSADDLLKVVAELDRTDPGWRLEQIEAKRPAIPDEKNGALQVLAFRDFVSDLRGEPRIRQASSTWQSQRLQERLSALEKLAPTDRLTDSDASDFRAELKRVETALLQARKLAGYPQGRFPIIHKRDGVSTLLPHLAQNRQLVRLLYLDAVMHTHDRNRSEAVRDCLGMAHAANALRDEPIMISQHVRMDLCRFTVRALEHLAARGTCTDRELAPLQEVLADATKDPLLLIGARGDRAMTHDSFSALGAGDLSMREFLGLMNLPEAARPLRPKEVRQLHVWALRYFTKIVEITRMPTERRPALLEALDAESKSAPGLPQGFATINQSYVTGAVGDSAHLALLRSTVAALAAERYRLVKGEWPVDLAALVPAYLQEVPVDPFDARPLRYRRGEDGVVVYSVGKDGTDDGGNLNRSTQRIEGTDTGFQLWDEAKRR